ncbi:hypothetical protein CH339_19145, partial [Rhodobium orientis]
ERGFSGQSWLTFRQALSLGGNVRKGDRPPALMRRPRGGQRTQVSARP